MPDLVYNPATVARVTAYEYGPEQTDGEGNTFRPVVGVLPGVRIDVQRQCIEQHPALASFMVEPAAPVHDCGPNGVRLYAGTEEEIMAAAPITGSLFDLFIEEPDDVA